MGFTAASSDAFRGLGDKHVFHRSKSYSYSYVTHPGLASLANRVVDGVFETIILPWNLRLLAVLPIDYGYGIE